VVARDGWLTLEGQVDWNYVRERAETAVRRVRGVNGVSNFIEVRPRVASTEVKRRIEESFRRNAELDANRITVEADGGLVRLRGTVRGARGSRASRLDGARREPGREPHYHRHLIGAASGGVLGPEAAHGLVVADRQDRRHRGERLRRLHHDEGRAGDQVVGLEKAVHRSL
jgi:hypothetical protein